MMKWKHGVAFMAWCSMRSAGTRSRSMVARAMSAAVMLCLLSAPVFAQNEEPTPSGTPMATPSPVPTLQRQIRETGQVSLSIDGLGTSTSSGIIQVQKPAGATVRRAFLAAASGGISNRIIANGDVQIDGSGVNWTIVEPALAAVQAYNHWAEVTSLVKTKIDAAPAGRVDFTITESGSSTIEGEILAVIFDDPNELTTNTVVLFFGGQSSLGARFGVNLIQPVDTTDPDLAIQMSLGISYSNQSFTNTQVSQIDVNGSRVTSSAGGEDDGETAGGALFTVGGLDDSFSNPDPFAAPANPRTDDELYDLLPFVAQGSTRIAVDTLNPSNDDNLFFVAFFFRDATATVDVAERGQGQGAVAGNGTLSTVQTSLPPSALARNRRKITTTFSGYNNRKGVGGSVIYTDRINGIRLRSTQISSVEINGNTATISGIANVNGIGGYNFVLTAIDNVPSYSLIGDGFSLQIAGNEEFFSINSTFAPGGVRVTSTGTPSVGPPALPPANRF